MSRRDEVLIVSRRGQPAEAVHALIRNAADLAVNVRVLDERTADPIEGLGGAPDVLILRVNGAAAPELDSLAAHAADERPPLIVIADAANADCMRAAMQAGARDFLIAPVAAADLLAAIRRVTAVQRTVRKTQHRCRTTVFVNAKGGSGATFLACNVAHLAATVSKHVSLLMDLDLQFATLPQYLDIRPARGLLDALEDTEELDNVAMSGYLTQHTSGLAVLAGSRDGVLMPQQEQMTDRFDAVLRLLTASHERLIVDMPRQIEPLSAHVLERADDVVIVLQQSVASLHDATRMYDVLTRSFALPSDHIHAVVNRHRKNASVEVSDIRQALHGKEPICVPNDFRAVTESTDMGIPLYECARRSPVTKALLQIEQQLGGTSAVAPPKSFLPRVLRAG